MKKLGFILSFFSAVCSFANDDLICTDLFKLSQTAGTFHDGTGSTSKGKMVARRKEEAVAKVYEQSIQQFRNILLVPRNSKFREIALNATQLNLHPYCKGSVTKPSANCVNILAEGLTEALAKYHQTPPTFRFSFGTKKEEVVTPELEAFTKLTDSTEFTQVKIDFAANLRKELGGEATVKKVKDTVFPKVKEISLKKIDSYIKSPTLRESMREKIMAMQFDSSDCAGNSFAGDSLPAMLASDATYQDQNNTFKYCLGLGADSDSEFQMAFVVAHEVAHSLDPCLIASSPPEPPVLSYKSSTLAGMETEYPFQSVITCLRDPKSVNAKNSAPAPDSTGFCWDDQVTESFADWLGTEILSDYMSERYGRLSSDQMRIGYANVWRPFEKHDLPDVHARADLRANNLFLVNPKVRQQMKCPTDIGPHKRYCEAPKVNSTENSLTTPQSPQRGTR